MALPDAGLPAVHPAIADDPRARWWAIDESGRGSLIPTASIVGQLRGTDHPWLRAATDFCWTRIEALNDTHPYEIINCLVFLDNAEDRDRAHTQAKRLGDLVRTRRLVVLDPARPQDAHLSPGYATGEYTYPHDYAPRPHSLARDWFTPAELTTSLDHLAAEQAEDGGWSVRHLMWTPAVIPEWRGLATITALTVLQAHTETN